MSLDLSRACVRCSTDLIGVSPVVSYGAGTARRSVCGDCLSWAEKDALLSSTPPAPEPSRTAREQRFLRDAVEVWPQRPAQSGAVAPI
jgi:hypothetical protein